MSDPRVLEVAKLVTGYSIDVQPGETVLIHCTVDTVPMAAAMIAEVYKRGGYPFVNYVNEELQAALSDGADRRQAERLMKLRMWHATDMDCIIHLNVPRSLYAVSSTPKERQKELEKWNLEIQEELGLNWERSVVKPCVMTFPTYLTANNGHMSLIEYTDLYYKACTADYPAIGAALERLSSYMNDISEVHLLGVGTDLRFSVKGMKMLVSAGDRNMPDGEGYCSPVIDSAEGVISYNIPSFYRGTLYENVVFELSKGKIVKAESNYTDRINEVLDMDEGARCIGEFAIAVNPHIVKPSGTILFDEKMTGSIHFTPGREIWKAGNGNRSIVHWDLVYCQLPQYGGGEMLFDGTLVRKDGRFVVPELECLNPEHLV